MGLVVVAEFFSLDGASSAEAGLTALGLSPAVRENSEVRGVKGFQFVYYLGVPAAEAERARAYLRSFDKTIEFELVGDPAAPAMKADPRPVIVIVLLALAATLAKLLLYRH